METPKPPTFLKEREKTDKSLTHERGRADESFEAYKGNAESQADKSVTKNRLETDQARSRRRSQAEAPDAGVLKERTIEDRAIKNERLRTDQAIGLERDEKERLVNKLMSVEREATDKNLLGERAKTDHESELSEARLLVEKTAHSQTKSAMTTREEFVAIVSHDLRNPLGAILSASEMLLEESRSPDDNKKLLALIQRNAQTGLRLISDILDMERMVEGKLQLQLAPFSLSDLIFQSVESSAHVATDKSITLKFAPTHVLDRVLGDRDRIGQILSNLIGNALKFTPAQGFVTVTTEETETEFKISVRDTGPGIPDEQKETIFERFTQLGNKDRHGLGMGLYIAKTLVESHNGKIGVTSVPGSGSTFHFTLPK